MIQYIYFIVEDTHFVFNFSSTWKYIQFIHSIYTYTDDKIFVCVDYTKKNIYELNFFYYLYIFVQFIFCIYFVFILCNRKVWICNEKVYFKLIIDSIRVRYIVKREWFCNSIKLHTSFRCIKFQLFLLRQKFSVTQRFEKKYRNTPHVNISVFSLFRRCKVANI